MPVFNLELKFDEKGAVTAVRQIDKVTDATNGATVAIDELGDKGKKNIDKIVNASGNAANAIEILGRQAKQASQQIENISNSTKNAGNAIDQLGKMASEAVKRLSEINSAAKDANKPVKEVGENADKNKESLAAMGKEGSAAADAISGKMKGLVKDVIALAAAYASVKSAMAFMNRGLEFNSNLEQSQIGIASLLTSMVKIQDEQGRILEGEEKYNAAKQMSVELMQQIQQLGLETTADSQSIVEGFQAILAPALQAGMALQDIPRFAVQGAQALQTLGLPLNQIKFELEALLSGNINLSQDVLAPQLFSDVKGNLKEYIQGLKESGQLIDEIFKRLKPFELAGKDVAQTWGALKSNLSEAMDVLAGQSATNLTSSLKESVGLLNELLVSSGNGELGIGKDFKNIAQVLADIESFIGGALVSATQKVVDLAREFNDYLGSEEGARAIEYLTTAIKALGAALMGFAASRTVAFGVEKWKAIISAVANYKNGLIEVARQELVAAQNAKTRQQAFMATERAQTAAANSSKIRQAQIARETALINQEAAAQQRLNSVTTMGAGKATLGTAMKGLASTMGGPLNIAITGLVTGLSLLTLVQDNSAQSAERAAAAQKGYTDVIEGAIDATGKLTRKLTEGEKVQAQATERQLSMELVSKRREIVDKIKAINNELEGELNTASSFGAGIGKNMEEVLGIQNQRKAIQDVLNIFEKLRKEEIGLEQMRVELGKIRSTLFSEADKKSPIAVAIDEIINSGDLSDKMTKLEKTREVLKKNEEATQGTAKVAQDNAKAYSDFAQAVQTATESQQDSIKTEEDAVKWLKKRYEATEEGKKALEEDAKATDELAFAKLEAKIAEMELAAAAATATAAVFGATEAQIAEAQMLNGAVLDMQETLARLRGARDSLGKPKSGKGVSGGGSGKGKSDLENATKKWAEFEQQLSQLEGKSTSAAASLDKTLDSIEETGKAAKKSADEIDKMKQAFIDASDKKALQELNKELLQLEGNTRQLQDIERAEKSDQLKTRISEIRSLSEDEKKILLNRAEVAIQRDFKVKDLQTAVDFMKDLESLGGEYGESLALQNQLIENQALLYRETLPASMQPYVDEWERLKMLGNDRSFMAGLERGIRKFGADYGNVANQVENFTTQMGSHISNTLADAFMKGKFSAEDFFSSLISMAAQAASNAFIGQIFSGIGSAVGGLFSSGANYSAGQTATMQANGMQAGYGGWLTGVHGHHKGGIVGKDYTFKRDMPLSAFYGAPKFHMGGGFFRYDEYPAILQSGERVLNRAETAAYHAGQASTGNGWGGKPVVNVNINNESGTSVQAQGEATPNGQGGFDLSLVITQVEQGIVKNAKQGKSPLMQYQQSAYGLSRAGVLARGRGRA